MITRIVKMTFRPEACAQFEAIFESSKNFIAACEGCNGLRLWKDHNDNRIYFTYSLWDSEQHLDDYRNSALFSDVWGKTKVLFDAKPEAWSVDEKQIVK